jgi:hypothetical protein
MQKCGGGKVNKLNFLQLIKEKKQKEDRRRKASLVQLTGAVK